MSEEEKEKILVFKDGLEEIFGRVETVKAIETLEYHNKNLLAIDDARRSRYKIRELNHILETLDAYIKKDTNF